MRAPAPVFEYDARAFNYLHRLTEARIEDKRLAKRRPPVAVRLPADEWTRLEIKIELSSSPLGWTLAPHIDVQAMNRIIVGGAETWGRGLRARLLPTGDASLRRWWRDQERTARELAVMTTALDAFAESPLEQLADSNHCCCCGRGLTDSVSRARGIGPECIKFIDSLLEHNDARLSSEQRA